jgi:DNA-binding XRE family transcriptional regulator
MQSPLQAFRERLGLTVGEMAAALGLIYSAYYNAERGLGAIPRKAIPALEELGADTGNLAQLQKQWISDRAAARRQAILAKVKGAA